MAQSRRRPVAEGPRRWSAASRPAAALSVFVLLAAAAGLPALFVGAVPLRCRPDAARASRVGRRSFDYHGRDPTGIKHVETRKQVSRARYLKKALERAIRDDYIQVKSHGAIEMLNKVRIDDIIMTNGCRGAFIHVGSDGSRLEQRQLLVWLQRNKGKIKTGLARFLYEVKGPNLPRNIFFVESNIEQFREMVREAERTPEFPLPNPLAAIEKKLKKPDRNLYTIGDPTARPPKRGYRPRRPDREVEAPVLQKLMHGQDGDKSRHWCRERFKRGMMPAAPHVAGPRALRRRWLSFNRRVDGSML